MEINLSPWQTQVMDSQIRYKVICTGRRSGKTLLSTLKVIELATNKKCNVWYLAPTYRQAKQILWEMLNKYMPLTVVSKKNETELSIELINGSIISLKGCENVDSLRGVGIHFAIFDECAFIDHWEQVWKVMLPTLVDYNAPCWFISSPNGFNHFKDMYDTVNPMWKSFHFTSYDNPYHAGKYDPEGQRQEIDAAKATMDADSFAQEFMGEFRKMSGLIYKDFTRETHMVDVPDLTSYTFTRALDFGFAHKTALLYFAISPIGDAIYAYDGLYESGYTITQIGEVCKVKDAGKVITNPVADSAQPASIEELKRMGVSFNAVEKEKDSVKNGIVKVAELLKVRKDTGKPTLMFSKHLTWIADEFERYRWVENKSADDSIKEVPYKVNDDAMDAIRYFAMNFQKQTQQVPKYNKQKWSI
jgi:PBSX family phage terminase large subunit